VCCVLCVVGLWIVLSVVLNVVLCIDFRLFGTTIDGLKYQSGTHSS